MPKPANTGKKQIVIFASGTGTNAENIINYFHKKDAVKVRAVFSNVRTAPVLRKAHQLDVQALHFDREALYGSNDVLNLLKDMNPDLIVLAGFLWIFPQKILKQFPNKVINIHPALLPKYGGKGMYGTKVHQAILKGKEVETGISVHYVNEHYDEGKMIFQKSIGINKDDTVETIAKKVHALEYEHYPKIIEELLFPGSDE